jgi:hypothetical protein
MRLVILSLLLVSLASSCNKYRLNADKEILVGEWEWTRSDIDNLSGGAGSTSVSPTTEDFTASVTFAKRNKITFRKDGEITLEGRIKILSFSKAASTSNFSWRGTFRVVGEEREYSVDILAGDDDAMNILGFPYTGGGNTYVRRNIFHRK